VKRNLLFHMYAKRKTHWAWHVEKLLEHSKAWNGRRIVGVVVDDWTESEDTIRRALEPLGAEIMVRRNDAELGETKHFVEMLGMLESLDPQEATFYAHTKGVSREGPELPAIKMWCRAMYDLCLSRPDVIEKLLETAAAAGAFRVQIPHSGSTWCYAGTFFWLKHSTLFSNKNWKDVEPGRWGVEGYPGRHLKFEDSIVLNRDVIDGRHLPNWLYGREGSGVTESHLKMWMENLWRMV
jgi:hypothetical protein